jgi:hypothetical protein
MLLLITSRECARRRLVSATTAFSRSISRRVSRIRADTGLAFNGFSSIAPQEGMRLRSLV